MAYRRKIVVIADDFTGAAEIGGIGLRHGFNVVIETEPSDNKDADMVVIASDSRSMNIDEAKKYITRITQQLVKLNPLIIYKKIDSVLRGNVSEELIAQMQVMQKNRAVIVAANPVFNRIIKDGKYFIDNVPLNQTCFANDSQYPIKHVEVLKILSDIEGYPVINLKSDDILPERGIIVGDVENIDDLSKWALKYNENTLFAGASGFFDSLLMALRLKNGAIHIPPGAFGKNVLFVLGSSYPKDVNLLSKMTQNGHYISNMPAEIYNNKDFQQIHMDRWVNDIVRAIREQQKVIVASMHSNSREPDLSFRIKRIMAELVKKVYERAKLNEILIEGGSTTSEILDCMNIKKLIPLQELSAGVIRMNVDGIPDLCITTKPGSYLWPENVWLPTEIERLNNKNLVTQ